MLTNRPHTPSLHVNHSAPPSQPPPQPLDDAAFVGELTQFQSALRLYVQALMPGDPACSDVTQAANAKIWQNRADFAAGTSFNAWALTLARYEVLTHRKRQSRDARLQFCDELEQTVAADLVHATPDESKYQSALQVCLEKLTPRNRRLLLDRYSTTDSLTQFARRVNRTAESLKVTLSRLRKSLGQCIERRLAAEEYESQRATL